MFWPRVRRCCGVDGTPAYRTKEQPKGTQSICCIWDCGHPCECLQRPHVCPAKFQTQTYAMDPADEYLTRTDLRIEQHRYDVADEVDAELVRQLEGVKAGRVPAFFYPNAGFDWEPIFRLSHLADVFVFADGRATESRFDQAFDVIRKKKTKVGEGLQTGQVGDPLYSEILERELLPVAVQEHLPWVREDAQPVAPWVAAKALVRYVGHLRRRVWLVFIGGSPLAAYRALFAERRIAPRCLCLRQLLEFDTPPEAMAAYGQRNTAWMNAAHWGSPFSEIVQEAGALPEFLVGERDLFRWPHRVLRQPLERWPEVPNAQPGHVRGIWVLPGARWPELRPKPVDASRRMTVTRRPIDPELARRFDAVVISPFLCQRYTWPEQTRIVLTEEPDPDLHLPPNPAVLVCDIRGKPLAEGLRLLEQVAAEHSLRRFAVESFGFEDEAEFLVEWRQSPGAIREVSFHVDSDGLFLDFAPQASATD